jgi:hypothetical protein
LAKKKVIDPDEHKGNSSGKNKGSADKNMM